MRGTIMLQILCFFVNSMDTISHTNNTLQLVTWIVLGWNKFTIALSYLQKFHDKVSLWQ